MVICTCPSQTVSGWFTEKVSVEPGAVTLMRETTGQSCPVDQPYLKPCFALGSDGDLRIGFRCGDLRGAFPRGAR